MTTFLVIMSVWLGLNVAFVTIRLYATTDLRREPSKAFRLVRSSGIRG